MPLSVEKDIIIREKTECQLSFYEDSKAKKSFRTKLQIDRQGDTQTQRARERDRKQPAIKQIMKTDRQMRKNKRRNFQEKQKQSDRKRESQGGRKIQILLENS